MTTAQVSFACLAAALFTTGCAQTPNDPDTPQPLISSEPYAGPAVTIDSQSTTHTVVIATPTGGWSVAWDGQYESSSRIHLTIRRPNPEFAQFQQIVRHRVNSTIASDRPIEAYVRVIDHDDQTDTAPYLPAARSSG